LNLLGGRRIVLAQPDLGNEAFFMHRLPLLTFARCSVIGLPQTAHLIAACAIEMGEVGMP
jgi:hypothetical protein